MTTMFDKFFGMPNSVIRSGTWAAMKPAEQSLYTCLLHDSERYRTRELQRTDAQICKLAGLSSRACRDARIKLHERGLVRYKRGNGNVYVYTLCNPETGEPWPGDPKQPIRYIKKVDRVTSEDPRSASPSTNLAERDQPRRDIQGIPLSFDRPI
jgi:predicted DNA-binding transcriptional regulator